MGESILPERIRDFIQTCVPSVGSLEILLLIIEQPDISWTTDAVAEKLRSNRSMVHDFLLFFESKGLVIREANSSFCLTSRDASLISNLTELGNIYRERPVSVLNEIYRIPNKPGSKIQLFADAFKINKDDKQ